MESSIKIKWGGTIMKKHKTRKQKLSRRSKLKPRRKTAMVTEFFGYEKGKWVWCKQCSRCYQVGEHREKKDDLQYCFYKDCNGDAVIDVSLWETVHHFNPAYPEIPERNKEYLIDVELGGVWHEADK